MREWWKDSEHRRGENDKRKERRKVKYEKEKEERLRKIPSPFILSNYSNDVEQKTVVPTKNCVVCKKV